MSGDPSPAAFPICPSLHYYYYNTRWWRQEWWWCPIVFVPHIYPRSHSDICIVVIPFPFPSSIIDDGEVTMMGDDFRHFDIPFLSIFSTFLSFYTFGISISFHSHSQIYLYLYLYLLMIYLSILFYLLLFSNVYMKIFSSLFHFTFLHYYYSLSLLFIAVILYNGRVMHDLIVHCILSPFPTPSHLLLEESLCDGNLLLVMCWALLFPLTHLLLLSGVVVGDSVWWWVTIVWNQAGPIPIAVVFWWWSDGMRHVFDVSQWWCFGDDDDRPTLWPRPAPRLTPSFVTFPLCGDR